MQTPVLVLGRNDLPVLLKHGDGYLDDDQTYDLLGRTDPYMPAGLGGEAAFYTVYVSTTHFVYTVVLRVTIRIDGVGIKTTDIVLNTVPDSAGEQRQTEIDLSQAYMVLGEERLRYAPRGQSLDVTIETVRSAGIGVGGRCVIDGIECEFEVVQEGKQSIPEPVPV